MEAVLHPQFLAELLSPKPGMDLLALMEELEQEERLTPDQVPEDRGTPGRKRRVGQQSGQGDGAQVDQGGQDTG